MFVIFDDLYVYGKFGLWVLFLSFILVLDLYVHVTPHKIWKNVLDVDPPIMIKATFVPADYMIGNPANNFVSLSPERT